MSQVDKRTLDLIGDLSIMNESSSGPVSVGSTPTYPSVQSDTDNFLIDALMPEVPTEVGVVSKSTAEPGSLRSKVLNHLEEVSNSVNELVPSDDEYAVVNYLLDSLIDLLGGSPHE